MDKKLLVITAGTIAAGVGQEFRRQVNARSTNKKRLYTVVRSIDTTHLPSTYSNLVGGEWYAVSIDPQHIDAIQGNMATRYPELERLLYPDTLPETTMAGGGGIRYNGAGAVLINRDRLNAWFKQGFNDLASQGERQRNISVAIVISAVGATGSGSLEHLIEIIVKAAQEVNIATPLQCDVFVLQPGNIKITDLGEANTVALFAEMAASQQEKDAITRRRYQGRTVMMGWGDGYSLSSLEQLEEVTAAIIRVINDPISNISGEYYQRLVDNHVLHDVEPETGLPSHLSTATVVTINLGDLEEQFFKRDVHRLLDAVVIGKPSSREERPISTLQNVINDYLRGNEPIERYEHLLDRLTQSVGTELQSDTVTPAQVRRVAGNVQAQAVRLRGMWQDDQNVLTQARAQMNQQARTIADDILKDLKRFRLQAVMRGVPLSQVKQDYEEFQRIITTIQREIAYYDVGNLAGQNTVDVALSNLARAGFLNASGALDNALNAMRDHLRGVRLRTGSNAATNILRVLVRHCTLEIANLNVVISESQRSLQANPITAFQVENIHLLHLPALTNQQQVRAYYEKVSIFARVQPSDDPFDEAEEEQGGDSLYVFRRALGSKLEILFSGDFPEIFSVFNDYSSRIIKDRMTRYSVLDVLLEQNVLQTRMTDAAEKATSLITLNKGLAPHYREMRHVVAFYRDNQQKTLQTVIDKTFIQGETTLVRSEDPTEIVVFYYLDGLPMSAVNDLSGRCLNAFLTRRQQWHLLNSSNGRNPNRGGNRSMSVPVYSGRDAEEKVRKMGVIHSLYKVRNKAVVKNYSEQDVPDLKAPNSQHDEDATGGNQ